MHSRRRRSALGYRARLGIEARVRAGRLVRCSDLPCIASRRRCRDVSVRAGSGCQRVPVVVTAIGAAVWSQGDGGCKTRRIAIENRSSSAFWTEADGRRLPRRNASARFVGTSINEMHADSPASHSHVCHPASAHPRSSFRERLSRWRRPSCAADLRCSERESRAVGEYGGCRTMRRPRLWRQYAMV
ncbi:uncharacterized protein LAESUDRAFT_227633 [Laetiporus sulphureus 93-53]|uniref:Uncharacterized protein n=1 Tax=Laetiporus sulphureus 93-53 TaxID=1314785 RepID=A0A165DQ21_9APHY|nr:uncharacterized protein LAESUDRAFT_227633 [Laetiporus sulphureus 93-53]KZT05375.1 hypothetical protein LAESUDRAFT_227633 [Laetiporus sulphureus 93-53]